MLDILVGPILFDALKCRLEFSVATVVGQKRGSVSFCAASAHECVQIITRLTYGAAKRQLD
jgi:ribosomal protein S5